LNLSESTRHFSSKDALLVKELQQGNEGAFEQLYHTYHRTLYGFLYNMIGSGSDVEDIIQEIFIRIWERRNDVNSNLSFGGLLFTVGKNLALNLLRNDCCRQRVREELKQIIDGSINDVEQIVQFNELDRMVQDVLEDLPFRQKQIYTLNRIKGLSRQEIAELLNISIVTVDMHLGKALQLLRDRLYQVRDSG
jgi:RNA polymerase sigma-70 factor (ECF subfamily)